MYEIQCTYFFMNNMLTVEEVKQYLAIDEAELERYLKAGKLHAYKIGGTYLRFRKDEILNLLEALPQKRKSPVSFAGRIGDFWRFNNFYIISLAVVIVLAVLIARV